MRPEVNSPARPRGSLYDNVMQYLFNVSWRTATRERTSQRPDTVTFIIVSLFAPPLASIKGRGGQPSQGIANEPNTGTKDLGLTPSPEPLLQTTLAHEHGSSTLNVGYYSLEARTNKSCYLLC
jgi:hypothetical protein